MPSLIQPTPDKYSAIVGPQQRMTPKLHQTDSFEELAHEAMDFLVTEFGFRCVSSARKLLRYESPSIFVEVGHSDYDAEVCARVGRLGAPGVLPDQPSERLDFGLILAVADPAGYAAIHRDVPYSCARQAEGIHKLLANFARGLRAYGSGLLSADPQTYAEARKLRFWHAPTLPPEKAPEPDSAPLNPLHDQQTLRL